MAEDKNGTIIKVGAIVSGKEGRYSDKKLFLVNKIHKSITGQYLIYAKRVGDYGIALLHNKKIEVTSQLTIKGGD